MMIIFFFRSHHGNRKKNLFTFDFKTGEVLLRNERGGIDDRIDVSKQFAEMARRQAGMDGWFQPIPREEITAANFPSLGRLVDGALAAAGRLGASLGLGFAPLSPITDAVVGVGRTIAGVFGNPAQEHFFDFLGQRREVTVNGEKRTITNLEIYARFLGGTDSQGAQFGKFLSRSYEEASRARLDIAKLNGLDEKFASVTEKKQLAQQHDEARKQERGAIDASLDVLIKDRANAEAGKPDLRNQERFQLELYKADAMRSYSDNITSFMNSAANYKQSGGENVNKLGFEPVALGLFSAFKNIILGVDLKEMLSGSKQALDVFSSNNSASGVALEGIKTLTKIA